MKTSTKDSAWADLPVELWGLIITKLDLDPSSLLSVALTSKKVYKALEQTINVSEEQKKCWDLEFLGKPALVPTVSTYLRRLHQDQQISELITKTVETGEGLEGLVEYVADVGDEAISQLLFEQNSPYELLIRSAYKKQKFSLATEEFKSFRVCQMGRLTRMTIAERLLKMIRYKKLAEMMVEVSSNIDAVSGPEYILKACLVDPNYFQLMRHRHLVFADTMETYSNKVRQINPANFATDLGLLINVFAGRLEFPLAEGLGSRNTFLFAYDQGAYSVFSLDGSDWLFVYYDLLKHVGLECSMYEGYFTVSNGQETCAVDQYGEVTELKELQEKVTLTSYVAAIHAQEMFKGWTLDDLAGFQSPPDDMKHFRYPHSEGGPEWVLNQFAPHIERAYPHHITMLFEDFDRYTRKGFIGTYDELFFGSFGHKSLIVSNGTYETGSLVQCEEFVRIPQVTPVVYSTWDVEEFDGASLCSYYWMRGRYDCETPVIESSLTPYEPHKRSEDYDRYDDHNIYNYACTSLTGKFFEYFDWNSMRFVPNKFLIKWIKNHS